MNLFPRQQIYTYVSTRPGCVVFHCVLSHAVCIQHADAGHLTLCLWGLLVKQPRKHVSDCQRDRRSRNLGNEGTARSGEGQRSGEMVQWLGTLTALPEDSIWTPSTHVRQLRQICHCLLASTGTTHVWHTHTHIHTKTRKRSWWPGVLQDQGWPSRSSTQWLSPKHPGPSLSSPH